MSAPRGIRVCPEADSDHARARLCAESDPKYPLHGCLLQVLTLMFSGIDELGARLQSRRMVKRVLLAALVGAALVCPASAEETRVSVQMMGIGGMSCAHWQSTQARRSEGAVWIYGFWTGLNYVAAASDQSQSKIETTAIVANVEKTCAQLPSQALASAVWSTYLALDKSSR